jgi:hypothetical protein
VGPNGTRWFRFYLDAASEGMTGDLVGGHIEWKRGKIAPIAGHGG